MSTPEEFIIPETTPEMSEITESLRSQEAPEGFVFMGNLEINPFDDSTDSASQHVEKLKKRYGEDSVFSTSAAYNEDGSPSMDVLAVYKKEGVKPSTIRKRIVRKLGSIVRR